TTVATAAALDTVRAGALLLVAGATSVALAGTFVTRRVYACLIVLLLLPGVGVVMLRQPTVRTRVLAQVQEAANRHIGHVRTEGHAYKLLDQRFYSGESLESMTWVEAERFVVRALASVVVVPLPWQAVSRSELLCLPQQLVG